jgi:hypothetical protein
MAEYPNVNPHPGYPETPTLDKMKEAQAETQPAGEFIAWLQSCGLSICRYDARVERYWTDGRSIEQLLADWKGIELAYAEQEKQAVLDWFREQNR